MKVSLQEKFKAISLFLEGLAPIYQSEFLKSYPAPYPDFMTSWIDEVSSWDLEAMASFESLPHEDMTENPSFKDYLKSVRELGSIEQSQQREDLPSKDLVSKISLKKQHEIFQLQKQIDDLSPETIIDIGGGLGHLSRAITNQKNCRSICVDSNKELQRKGEALLNKSENRLIFEHAHFTQETELSTPFKAKESLLISLHGCGELSTHALKFATKEGISSLINLGCCYHKMNGQYNISDFSKNYPLEFSTSALHLASRSGRIVGKSDLEIRFKFKQYRHILHYFLNDKFKLSFSAIGNSTKSDYSQSFAKYALSRYPGDHLSEVSEDELNSFFSLPATQDKFKKNFAADIIRLLLGRLIELYLIYDRALYLEEGGQMVEVKEIFNRSYSPRNIMIKSQGQIY